MSYLNNKINQVNNDIKSSNNHNNINKINNEDYIDYNKKISQSLKINTFNKKIQYINNLDSNISNSEFKIRNISADELFEKSTEESLEEANK